MDELTVAVYPRNMRLPTRDEYLRMCTAYDGAVELFALCGLNILISFFLVVFALSVFLKAGLVLWCVVELTFVGFAIRTSKQLDSALKVNRLILRFLALVCLVPVVGFVIGAALRLAASKKVREFGMKELEMGLSRRRRKDVLAWLEAELQGLQDMSKPPTVGG